MDQILNFVARRRALMLLALVLVFTLGALGDVANPLLPVLPMLALGTGAGLAVALLLARRQPEAAWTATVLPLGAVLFAGFGTLALVQLLSGHPRGLLARHFDAPAALQDALIGIPPSTPRETAELRGALAQAEPAPRSRPASADEFLFNALLLRSRDEPLRAALALAEALRRGPDPRPDALLLHAGLLGTGIPAVLEALAEPPPGLSPVAKAHLAAMRLPPSQRAAALAALVEAHPEWLLGAAEYARAAIAAALPEGPTVAAARRIAAALDRFEDRDLAEPFAARFLDPAKAERLATELRGLAWVRDVAARRISVAALAPPPGMPNAPILVRVTPPEAARSVQFLRGQDAQGELWAEVPQRTDDTREAARDPVPTLRLMRPHRAAEMRFRYADRNGEVSEPVTWRFDPVLAMREAAQRALQRQGPFALYQPGRVAPGRLNALPIAGHFRAGLTAIEWFTDAERQPRSVRVGIADEAVMGGDPGRATVEFAVPPNARSLFLAAIYADGTRSTLTELPIR
jgi:hypothetical protein